MASFVSIARFDANNRSLIKALRQNKQQLDRQDKSFAQMRRSMRRMEGQQRQVSAGFDDMAASGQDFNSVLAAGVGLLAGYSLAELGQHAAELQQINDQLSITNQEYQQWIALLARGRVELDDVRDGFTELSLVRRRLVAQDQDMIELARKVGFAYQDAAGRIKKGNDFILAFFEAVRDGSETAQVAVEQLLSEAGFDTSLQGFIQQAVDVEDIGQAARDAAQDVTVASRVQLQVVSDLYDELKQVGQSAQQTGIILLNAFGDELRAGLNLAQRSLALVEEHQDAIKDGATLFLSLWAGSKLRIALAGIGKLTTALKTMGAAIPGTGFLAKVAGVAGASKGATAAAVAAPAAGAFYGVAQSREQGRSAGRDRALEQREELVSEFISLRHFGDELNNFPNVIRDIEDINVRLGLEPTAGLEHEIEKYGIKLDEQGRISMDNLTAALNNLANVEIFGEEGIPTQTAAQAQEEQKAQDKELKDLKTQGTTFQRDLGLDPERLRRRGWRRQHEASFDDPLEAIDAFEGFEFKPLSDEDLRLLGEYRTGAAEIADLLKRKEEGAVLSQEDLRLLGEYREQVQGIATDAAQMAHDWQRARQEQALAAFTLDSMATSIASIVNGFDSMVFSAKQLVKQLAAAAIKAVIISAVTGGQTTFLGAFTGALGVGPVRAREKGGFTPPGLTLVGEAGPELLQTDKATRVYSNETLREVLQGGEKATETAVEKTRDTSAVLQGGQQATHSASQTHEKATHTEALQEVHKQLQDSKMVSGHETSETSETSTSSVVQGGEKATKAVQSSTTDRSTTSTTNALHEVYAQLQSHKAEITQGSEKAQRGQRGQRDQRGNYIEKITKIPMRAMGGAANGLTWVGEHGMELVDFTQPAQVYSNEKLREVIEGGTSPGQIAQVGGDTIELVFAPTITSNDPEGIWAVLRGMLPQVTDHVEQGLARRTQRKYAPLRQAMQGA